MKKTILIAAVMFFAFSVAAFSQAQFQVGSTPVTTVASCGTTEITGDISFTRASNVLNAATGTITISYGVPITASTIAPAITITSIPVNGLVTVASTVTDLAAGRLVLAVAPNGNAIDAILVSGVRVNVAGNPTLSNLTATITATVNTILGGQTSVVVISSIASAIASIDTNNAATPPVPQAININAVAPALPATVPVNVTEGFLGAWNAAGQRLTFTWSSIPTGVTITFPASFTTTGGSTFSRAAAQTIPAPFVTSVSYTLGTPGGIAPVTLEVATLNLTIALATVPAPPSPLPQGTFTVTVDMGPKLGPAPDFAGSVVPQYTGTTCQRGPATVFSIVTATTNLLMPYAVYTGPTGYDTGIAIANTTKDPGAVAVPQNGTITFNFYPQTGDPFAYTTLAGSPGSGLNASGVLESGRLYAVLLSQLLTAAGKASSYTFSGYIIAVVGATNAHGQYFISDFEAFTNGALMLVINPAAAARNTAPENLNN